MTFDIAPNWLDLAVDRIASPTGSVSDPAGSAPRCPDRAALAALIHDLCAEGTLPRDQMTAMMRSPDLVFALESDRRD